jgi:hypothetical protein
MDAVDPALQVGKRAADTRDIVAELTEASVAVKAQPTAEQSGHMAVIQHSESFLAAEFTRGSGRTDALGELVPLVGFGAPAGAACAPAENSSDGPACHFKVALFAVLAAPFATAFWHVLRRRPCCLLREPFALQEAPKVHQGFAEAYYCVAQLTDATVAFRTQPPPDQVSCVAVVQVQLGCTRAALAGRRRRTGCLAAVITFPDFCAVAGSAHGLSIPFTRLLYRPRPVEGIWREIRSTALALLQLLAPTIRSRRWRAGPSTIRAGSSGAGRR